MQHPPPIMASEPNSFAHYTVTQRLPAIAQRVIAENQFSPDREAQLLKLIEDLPEGKITSIQNNSAPDQAAWDEYLVPYLGKCWLDIPWYFAEAYFYRRILAATDYFQTHIDPYALQKRLGLENAIATIQTLSEQINAIQGVWDRESFTALMYFALWGNRIDLSLHPAEAGTQFHLETTHDQRANLLADDTQQVANWLDQHRGRVDFIVDNAGLELFCDLCLADYLLTTQAASEVYLHVKDHPIFVSDAMGKDVYSTIETLAESSNAAVRSFGDRLCYHLNTGHLQLHTHDFWTAPLVFWHMPETVREVLKSAHLVLIKGDANYRRLLGDYHWDFTTPFAEIVSYFPAPLAALRTMKAELACGLQPSQVTALNAADLNWLTNGQRGVIQFANP
ncbi:MAG: damage-control phosphatase ARMT1 family protein [Elainellaceae cyanobacterium]